ncbi:MAG: hypothetical protein ACPL7O_13150, partial [Armatimonadota bacterium]
MSRRRRILILLPRGEAIRNIVYRGVARRLRESVSVIIGSVNPSKTIWDLMAQDCNGLFEIPELQEPYGVRVLRELLNAGHAEYVSSEAMRHRMDRRRAESSHGWKRMKLRAKLSLGRAFSTEERLRLLESMEELWSEHTAAAREATRVLDAWKPDLVFNASHVHGIKVRPVLAAARKLGIPIVGFLFSWDNLTTQGRIVPRYDAYLLWSDAMAEQLLRLYSDIDPKSVFVTGSPQFDCHYSRRLAWTRHEFCRKLGLDERRPVVLYTTGMPNHMPHEEDIVTMLAGILRSYPVSRRPQLVVRVYAKDRSGRFDEVFRRNPDVFKAPVMWESKFFTPLPEDDQW